MPIRRIKSKLLKGNAMQKNPVLRRHLPETRRLKPNVLSPMMKRYRTLFIKPDKGSQGKGIVRLKHQNNQKIQISWGLRHQLVQKRSVGGVLKRILNPKRTYLIQRGIPLAKYNKRLIDIRVYLQKPKKSLWIISGKVVRVGAAGRFVTNYHQGARPETIDRVLGTIYKNQPKKMNSIIHDIESISRTTARVLDRRFPGIRQLGIDIALDINGRIWILEVNTNPAFNTFKNLKNKTMYHRIVAFRRYIYSKYR